MIGAYYFSGWWRTPPTKHKEKWKDMREEFPEREPLVGWYDDVQEVMDEQIYQAAQHGLDFFNILWYPKRPKYHARVVDQNINNGIKFFVQSKNKSMMKFWISYTNHDHLGITTTEEWMHACDEWIQYFQDPQYLQVEGKPLFKIHGVHWMRRQWSGPDVINERLQELRDRVKAAGFPGILIVGGVNEAGWMGQNIGQVVEEGYDFLSAYGLVPQEKYKDRVISYNSLIYEHERAWAELLHHSPLPYVPYVTSGWDPRPWLGPDAKRWEGRTPEEFSVFLEKAMEIVDLNPKMRIPTKDGQGKRMIQIYAWNELGEGGFIIPTRGDGYEYIEVIARIKEKYPYWRCID